MKKQKLFNALDGLFAYDGGAVDSGIHDENLRAEVREYLQKECGEHELYPKILTEFIRKYYTYSPYGVEDIKAFIGWIDDLMER